MVISRAERTLRIFLFRNHLRTVSSRNPKIAEDTPSPNHPARLIVAGRMISPKAIATPATHCPIALHFVSSRHNRYAAEQIDISIPRKPPYGPGLGKCPVIVYKVWPERTFPKT